MRSVVRAWEASLWVLFGRESTAYWKPRNAGRLQRERAALVTKFPYAVVYREVQDEIEIIAIAHLKRRPKYWSSR